MAYTQFLKEKAIYKAGDNKLSDYIRGLIEKDCDTIEIIKEQSSKIIKEENWTICRP